MRVAGEQLIFSSIMLSINPRLTVLIDIPTSWMILYHCNGRQLRWNLIFSDFCPVHLRPACRVFDALVNDQLK